MTCTKLDFGDNGSSSYVLTQNYAEVIVKAGSDQYANTVFDNPTAGETVWADTNGNNTFDPGGQGGDKNISHIIFCSPGPSDTATLTLVKSVDNTLGGSATASDWTLTATPTGATTPTLSGAGGATGTVSTGTYTLAEAPTGASAPANYTEGSWTCRTATGATAGSGGQVTLQNGDNVTCTIVNTYTPPVGTCPENVLSVSTAAGYFDYSVSPGSSTYPLVSVTITTKAGVTLPEGCTWAFSLNSYNTEGATWATSGTQSLLDHQSTTLDSSKTSDTLTVQEPACFGQTDFYLGTTRFDGTDGALPHYNDSAVPTNLIAWSNGGQACTNPPATLTVIKQLVNTGGGDAAPAAFQIHVMSNGTDVTGSPKPGSSTGTQYTLDHGTYTVSETGGPNDYQQTSVTCTDGQTTTTDGSVVLAAGDNATCTIVNTYTPPQGPTVNLTVEKLICPSYGDVPANSNPGNAADYPPGSELNTSHQTTLVDRATDVPSNCTPASGWQFDVGTGASSTAKDYIDTVTHTLTTGTNGTDTLTLSSAGVAMIQKATSWDQGLLVREVMQPDVAQFGELRCYRDIENGDNLESLYNKDSLFTSDLADADGTLNLYCIAYNVAAPTISTSLSGGEANTGATITVLNGTSVTDTATLYDANHDVATGATGSIAFGLYTDAQCSSAATSGFTPSGGPTDGTLAGGVATSGAVTFTANGTYYWKASYAGDSHYLSTSACNESVVVQSEQPTTGTLVVVKDTSGGDGTFSFTGTGTGVDSSFNVTTTSGTGSQTFPGLTPGSGYAVSENAASGWTQTGASCTGEGNSPSAISIAAGQTVTCTFTNTKKTPPPPPPPAYGYFQFSKTVTGNLTGWAGGTFPFSVTCGGSIQTVSLPVTATGDAVTSQTFGPYVAGTVCSVVEGALPAAGTNANWANSPHYSPSGGSVTIAADQTVSVSVLNTRTYSPATTPPSPKPAGGVAGATGTPHPKPTLPATTEVPGQGGAPNGTILLLGMLGAASLALITATLLRKRLLDSVEK